MTTSTTPGQLTSLDDWYALAAGLDAQTERIEALTVALQQHAAQISAVTNAAITAVTALAARSASIAELVTLASWERELRAA